MKKTTKQSFIRQRAQSLGYMSISAEYDHVGNSFCIYITLILNKKRPRGRIRREWGTMFRKRFRHALPFPTTDQPRTEPGSGNFSTYFLLVSWTYIEFTKSGFQLSNSGADSACFCRVELPCPKISLWEPLARGDQSMITYFKQLVDFLKRTSLEFWKEENEEKESDHSTTHEDISDFCAQLNGGSSL